MDEVVVQAALYGKGYRPWHPSSSDCGGSDDNWTATDARWSTKYELAQKEFGMSLKVLSIVY